MPGLQRLRMSYEQWWALPDKPKTEWVDGEVVVHVPPTADHMDASFGFATMIKRGLPELKTYLEVGVQLPHHRVRRPDVMAVRDRPAGYLVEEVPVLVLEVLSASTRSEDTVRKSTEYLGAGVSQYWLVDPEQRTLEVYENVGDGWNLLFKLDDENPRGEVRVETHGVVEIDLPRALAGEL